MDDEIKEYLDYTSKLLAGQIRGVINEKARKENLELIQLTLINVWNKGCQYTQSEYKDKEILKKLDENLKSLNNG